MRRAPVPYAIAYVTLDEGPTMMTNIVDCDLDKIKIGQAVRLVFKPSEGGPPVPMFTPDLTTQRRTSRMDTIEDNGSPTRPRQSAPRSGRCGSISPPATG